MALGVSEQTERHCLITGKLSGPVMSRRLWLTLC